MGNWKIWEITPNFRILNGIRYVISFPEVDNFIENNAITIVGQLTSTMLPK